MEKQYSEPTLEVIAVGCGDVVTVSDIPDNDYVLGQLPTA